MRDQNARCKQKVQILHRYWENYTVRLYGTNIYRVKSVHNGQTAHLMRNMRDISDTTNGLVEGRFN